MKDEAISLARGMTDPGQALNRLIAAPSGCPQPAVAAERVGPNARGQSP